MSIDRLIIISLANFMLIIVYIAQIIILLIVDNFKSMKLLISSYELTIQTSN